jgi:hypothetical protein
MPHWFFVYKARMSLKDKIIHSVWPRLILGALALAIFALCLQDDWDIEITLSQLNHGFVAKVTKDSKENPGSEKLDAVATAALEWQPSFTALVFSVAAAQQQRSHFLLRSISARAPPTLC